MPITLSESPSEERFKSSLANIIEAVEPDIDSLPEAWKEVFEGPIKLLMGSKTCIGIIPEKRQWAMNEKAFYILYLLKYPDFINYDLNTIAVELGEYYSLINTGMASEGKFLLEGPMSRQFIRQTQEILETPPERRRRR